VVQRSQSGQPYFLFAQLDDWASPAFLDSHCFTYGGETEVDGQKLIEISFQAWEGIANPDMDGSMFIDPKTYQIRRTQVSLSKLPKELPAESGGVIVTTVFAEILPNVPVVALLDAETRQRFNPVNGAWEGPIEEHRLITVAFAKLPPP
jgi:hypothetical protein